MDHLYQQAVLVLGKGECVDGLMRECSRLAATLGIVFARGRGSFADVASAVASMEVACSQLRAVIGSDLVDLEKVAVLARLQRLVALHGNDSRENQIG